MRLSITPAVGLVTLLLVSQISGDQTEFQRQVELLQLNPVNQVENEEEATLDVVEPEEDWPAIDTPSKAVTAANADLMSLPEELRLFQYYVWFADGDPDKAKRCNFMVNNVVVEMTSTTVVEPIVINGGYLLRYDIRSLAPKNPARMYRMLDSIIDPAFYLITPQTVSIRIPVQPYKASDGKVYDYKVEERVVTAFGNSVAEAYSEAMSLQANCGRMVPIVSYEYLLSITQQSISGGKYLEFIEAEGKTLPEYLEKWAGVGLDEVFKNYYDQRSVTTISKVTGKERMVVLMQGHANKPGVNASQWSITFDVADDYLDAEESALRNLGTIDKPMFKFAGGEVIGERRNQGNVYLAFDADFNLIAEVPPEVTCDHLIPAKHGTKRLQAPISCYRCHNMKDSPDDPDPRGRKTLEFSARDLLRAGLDITGTPEEIEVLVGRYETDFNKPIRRAREDLSDFVVKCTQTPELSTTEVFDGIAKDYAAYVFDFVDSSTVVRELGIDVPDGMTDLEALISVTSRKSQSLVMQDPFIRTILIGSPIRRNSWQNVQQDMAQLVTPEDLLDQVSDLKKSQKTIPVKIELGDKDVE